MPDVDFDPAQLTDSQRTALGTFTSVTNQEPGEAVSLLQRSEWNVQIAIAKFFDGEAPDPVAEAQAAAEAQPPPPTSTSRREALLDGSVSPTRIQRSGREPAPRIVPQPGGPKTVTPPFLVQLLLTPFNLLTRAVGGTFSLLGYFLSFIPRIFPSFFARTSPPRLRTGRRPLAPRDTAARFAREFEEDYGNHGLPFFEGGYAQAYDIAKRDLKYLLVILLSPEHEDTDPWVRETLLSPEVTDFILRNSDDIILWAGSVQDSEAYQVSTALNCSKFPFAAVIVHTPQDSSTAMSVVARITGLMPPSSFTSQLKRAIDQNKPALSRVRSQRREQQATRNLREEQNSAYERSLALDRERLRQRREAEAAQHREEEETRARQADEQRQSELRDQWRRWRVRSIPPEPDASATNSTRLSLRMASGERVVRKFPANAIIEDVYAFVDCYECVNGPRDGPVDPPERYMHGYDFRLVSPMPRHVYVVTDRGTVGSEIGRSGNLIVEPIGQEE